MPYQLFGKNLDFTVYQSLTLERKNMFLYHYGL